MQIFILLTMLSFLLFGCNKQTLPTQVSTTHASIPTPDMIVSASAISEENEMLPTIFASSTFEVTEVFPAVTLSPLPNEVFYFGATPPASQVGGMTGVFYRQFIPNEKYILDERCAYTYDILRFYEDGVVMDVPACADATDGYVFDKVWPDISQWLNRENNDPTLPRGTYYIVENQIWFTTTGENDKVVADYFGIISEDRMILSCYSHYNGHQATEEEFIFLNGSDNP